MSPGIFVCFYSGLNRFNLIVQVSIHLHSPYRSRVHFLSLFSAWQGVCHLLAASVPKLPAREQLALMVSLTTGPCKFSPGLEIIFTSLLLGYHNCLKNFGQQLSWIVWRLISFCFLFFHYYFLQSLQSCLIIWTIMPFPLLQKRTGNITTLVKLDQHIVTF